MSNTGDLKFDHVHVYADSIQPLHEYKALEDKMNRFDAAIGGIAGVKHVAAARAEWLKVEPCPVDPSAYKSQNQDIVRQLITGMNWRIIAHCHNAATASVLLASSDPRGAKFVVTGKLAGGSGAEPEHFSAAAIDRYYAQTQRPGIAVLAFEVGDTNSVAAVAAAYKSKHPNLCATPSVLTFGSEAPGMCMFEVFAYYKPGSSDPDTGTVLRFVQRQGDAACPLLPGLTSTPAQYCSLSVPTFSDHWVSNVFDRKQFLQTLHDTLGFTPKVDFNAGVVAAGEAIIESTVTGNSSAFVPVNKQQALPDQSQIYLPINNALSTVGHVHGFLKEIGQGVQHVASRVMDLVALISTTNSLREITGEGFTFLKIPMSYYGFLSAERLAEDAGVALEAAGVAFAALHDACIVSSVGVVDMECNAEAVRAALAPTAASASSDAIVPAVLRARYNNIFKLIGDALPERAYLDIVRNHILIDVQGKDMLCQIFTSNVLQRAAGDEAPFLEFIQRICYEGNDGQGQPVPLRPGCGGFGIRNFLTLFLSIEVNKAMSDMASARAAKNDAGMFNPVCSYILWVYAFGCAGEAIAKRQIACLTHQLDESNPILTSIADAGCDF